MDTVEENTKAKYTLKVLFYRLLQQIGWVLFCGTLVVSCWLGYLGWSHIQMTDPPNPENIILYASGAMFGITVCSTQLFGLLTWRYAVNRADGDRNYARMFLHFSQKHFSNVVPLAEKCKDQSELMAELQRAGVDATEINITRGKELDDTMSTMRKSDIDDQFVDLAGFIGTIRRQNLRYIEQLEQAEKERSKQRQLLDDLVAVRAETNRIEQAASEVLTSGTTGVVRLKQSAAE